MAYQHLNSEGELAFLLQRDGVADFGYAIYHPAVEAAGQIYDALLAAGCNFLRELCGMGWNPSEVFFPHAKPLDVGPYQHFFRAPLRFDAEFCALRFPAHWMDQIVLEAHPALLRIAEKKADGAGHGELLEQTYRALRVSLVHGKSSGNEVAQVLAMHRRTLNRRLKAQGATFQQVLDGVRFGVARQLLEDSQVAIDDVAATLGYASVGPFTRSFRRWSGTTPGRWRHAARETQVIAS